MRTTGVGKYYCACCGFDCSPPDKDGNADKFCPARDGDVCEPKRRKPKAARKR